MIMGWYEPYFVWDWYHGDLEDDIRTEAHADERTTRFVRKEFAIYQSKAGNPIIAEKLPQHSMQIPFVDAVFPEARYLHIYRDGRDVTLSIAEQWKAREAVLERGNALALPRVFMQMMRRQPFLRNRVQAVLFEARQHKSISPRRYLNKARWGGIAGWGPRFEGWPEALAKHTLMEFHALQWAESVDHILKGKRLIPDSRWLDISYESLVSDPSEIFNRVFGFLSVPPMDPACWNDITTRSVGRWRTGISDIDLERIDPILSPVQRKLNEISR
jgi:hypothetical protein